MHSHLCLYINNHEWASKYGCVQAPDIQIFPSAEVAEASLSISQKNEDIHLLENGPKAGANTDVDVI